MSLPHTWNVKKVPVSLVQVLLNTLSFMIFTPAAGSLLGGGHPSEPDRHPGSHSHHQLWEEARRLAQPWQVRHAERGHAYHYIPHSLLRFRLKVQSVKYSTRDCLLLLVLGCEEIILTVSLASSVASGPTADVSHWRIVGVKWHPRECLDPGLPRRILQDMYVGGWCYSISVITI